MHELGIATTILEVVRTEAQQTPGSRLVAVGLKLGELSGVDPDALSFCFETLVKESELVPIELVIERTRRRHRCPSCERAFDVVDYEVACPDCGEPKTEMIGGDEMEIVYIEVDD